MQSYFMMLHYFIIIPSLNVNYILHYTYIYICSTLAIMTFYMHTYIYTHT